jgi:hypothetical protein
VKKSLCQDLNPCHVVSSDHNNGLARHATHSATENNRDRAVTKISGAICLDFETDYPTSVSLKILSSHTFSRSKHDRLLDHIKANKISITQRNWWHFKNWKFENLTLKMKIPFEENMPSYVRLYVGTWNNPNLSILGAFWLKMYLFPLWPWKWRSRSYIFKFTISKASGRRSSENFELS